MDPKTLQMVNRIPIPGIALDLRDFELLRQVVFSHLSGERGIGTYQESIHCSNFALAFSFNLPSHAGSLPLQISGISV
jgi:hypothetical protein